MFPQDFTKMFDPQTITQNMQSFMNMNAFASNSQQAMSNMKELSALMAGTWSAMTDKQTKMAQHAMEDCIECMRDLSTAKSMEDYMSKQATWVKKAAEASQTNAQELASTLQKGQTQATDLIGKMVTSSMEWAKQSTQKSGK